MKSALGLAITIAVLTVAHTASAQPLGGFRWQLQPYCNVLTLNVTQSGAIYTLDGVDDQCGAGQKASVVGTAFLNPDGTVGMGLTTVIAPGGAPVHIDARIGLASLAGPWRDSAGNGGTFAFTPGAGTGGALRPVTANGLAPSSVTSAQIASGAVGGAQINTSQVQARVSGECPIGRYMVAVGVNGTALCGRLYAEIPFGSEVFSLASVPPLGQAPAGLATIGFGTFEAGTAVLRGRGFCTMSPLAGQDNAIVISAGTTAALAFQGVVESGARGVVKLPASAAGGSYQLGWTSENRLQLETPGDYTVTLFGRHEAGSVANTCSGSFTVHFFPNTTIDQ